VKCPRMSVEEFFKHRITDEIRSMVEQRILCGGNLGRRGCDQQKAKLALLIVREINPTEVFNRDEAALLFGVNLKTLRDKTRPFSHSVNMHD
jgi:hypothetical protein